MKMPKKSHMKNLPTTTDELICFALYSASNAVNRSYKPHLSKLGLTYPQYITLVALWEEDGVSVGELCGKLTTETSTMTPLLKRLEKQGRIKRIRDKSDERKVIIHLTKEGRMLEKNAPEITRCIVEDTGFSHVELEKLTKAVGRLRDNFVGKQ